MSFVQTESEHIPLKEQDEEEDHESVEESHREKREEYENTELEGHQSSSSYDGEKSQVQSLIDDEVDREKEHFLSELRKYRGQTTRDFSMQDTLTDIQFEYDRLKGTENAANVVRIMGIVLQVIVYSVQWGNGKFGPLLKLDNGDTSWAMQTAERISNREYDNVLEKLYRKHWRKGSMSPEAELGMMLVGSAGVFHFQTHVNEKLSKRSGTDDIKKSNGNSSSGFNFMDLLGPVMGLMNGGGDKKQASNPFSTGNLPFASSQQPVTAEPPKRFDFVAGRPQNTVPPKSASATNSAPAPNSAQAFNNSAPAFNNSAPAPNSAPVPNFAEIEQQFAKRQQDMLNRMEEVTRRADDQMRASQARQMDLERQLQQTQMRLHQVSQQAMQQQAMQQQQQQAYIRQQQQQLLSNPLKQASQILSHQQQQLSQPRGSVVTQRRAPSLEVVDESSPPLSPVGEVNGSEGEDGEQDEEVKFDVKEVMVAERQKRKKAPVELEIDELSLAL